MLYYKTAFIGLNFKPIIHRRAGCIACLMTAKRCYVQTLAALYLPVHKSVIHAHVSYAHITVDGFLGMRF